ncbi:MAG: hypothetical protein M3440_02910 [Chloroflexota bacterium]|nr:hypothetical protein [Chloroflexota bacterium]
MNAGLAQTAAMMCSRTSVIMMLVDSSTVIGCIERKNRPDHGDDHEDQDHLACKPAPEHSEAP